jgi:hypothetical protein
MGLHGFLRDSFTFLYVDNVRTSQEAHLWAFTACYRDSFTFLYVDDLCTSQETRLWAFSFLRDSFTFLYVDNVRSSQEAHLWAFTACYRDSFMSFLHCTVI